MLTIDQYQITTQLYESVHSVIYRGRRKVDDRPVILKLLKADYPTPEEVARFRQEYEMLRALDVDGVIKVYALEPYNNSFVMVLEDFGGASLARLLSDRRLELPEFLWLAIRIADILEAIHQQHVIHKDINPSNIVWNSESDQVKIIDFGTSTQLSHARPEIRNPNVLEGTLPYISPEQTGRMNRAVDYRTDLYSLGGTLYRMLTGQLPFQTDDAMELVHCHLAKMPVPPYDLHPPTPLKGGFSHPSLEGKSSHSPLEGGQGGVLQILSDIIMKLLAKNAEDRYQSAYGLKYDLEYCLANLQGLEYHSTRSGQALKGFIIAQHDMSDRFQIPQKLYGREQEIATLLAAFDRVATPKSEIRNPKSEMLLVTGYAGIGKSALVNEIHKPITKKRGHFISGKFDQFTRNIPYSAMIQAFQGLMRHLLTEPDEQLAVWKEKLLQAVGANGQVIIDVIPDVALLIGEQPDVPELPPQQTRNRFNFVFQNFVRAFAEEEHPLIMFLDDLQWADASSLKLLELCMADPNTTSMLIIWAYRDSAVSETHPLTATLRDLQEAGATVNTMTLTPLALEHVEQLVAETLNVRKPTPTPSQEGNVPPRRAALPLAELLLQKTGGNPFFLRQFLQALYEEGFLELDINRRVWTWELDDIQQREMTDNVVELMTRKIQKLPQATQHVLRLAACIGNQFDLQTLSLIYEHSVADTMSTLHKALQEELLVPLDESYKYVGIADKTGNTTHQPLNTNFKFLHNRIQQAAYTLLADADRQRVHLAIGRSLLTHTPEAGREERMFEIVNHLNHGRALITTSSEKTRLAELNLKAGRRAKASTAYQPAYRYLQHGLRCLDTDCWQRQYQLTLTLYEETAEAAYLSGDFDTMEELAEVVLRQTRAVLETITVSEIRIQASIARNHPVDALRTGFGILRRLGVRLSEKPGKVSLIYEFLKVKLALLGTSIEALLDMPDIQDPQIVAIIRIMNCMGSAAYAAIPALIPILSLKANYFSIRYGHTPTSPYGYAGLAMILCGGVGDIETGCRFGQLALTLQAQINGKELETRMAFLVHAFVRPWKEHIRHVLPPLHDTYRIGLETGDFEFAGHASSNYTRLSLFTGDNLSQLAGEMQQFSHVMAQLKQEIPLHCHNLFRQAALNLIGDAQHPTRLVGESYDEEKMTPLYQHAKNHALLSSTYVLKVILCYLFQEYSQAVQQASIAEQYLDGMIGSYYMPLFHFYDSLTRLALWDDMSGSERRRTLKKVAANQKKMKKWARHAPMNHLHKWQLVEAERARVLGKEREAMDYYENAIAGAREHKYTNEEALANELAARFYLANDNNRIAYTYMREARYGYLKWGAQAKVQHLDDTYPELLTARDEHHNQHGIHLTTTKTPSTGTISQTLDLSTVIKASHTISGEMVLAELLKKMMQIMIENAGAQHGFLLLDHDGTWCIEAEGMIGNDGLHLTSGVHLKDKDGRHLEGGAHRLENVRVMQSVSLESAVASLATTIVYYVARTKGAVVLNDATHEGAFTADPYVISRQPRSILCLPLLNQGELSGILYLENNLSTGAFTPDRVEVLHLLSSQMAISIENARLYTDLNQSEQRYRILFEDSKDAIFITTPEGTFVDVNQACLDIFKGSRADMLTTQVSDLYVHLADRRRFMKLMAQEGAVRDFETTLRKTDGTPMECLLTATVRRSRDGEILAFQGIVRNITERKRAEREREAFTRQLSELNTAYEHFVPDELLKALGQNNILDVKLGDYMYGEMTIMFSDIRSYTTLSETMTPQEVFNFTNGYHNRMTPIIRAHNGFVQQFQGDGAVSVFPENSDDGLQAAIAIQRKREEYNRERTKKNRTPIRVGIGLHSGPLMVGIIGDSERWESGVPSDTVNTAARMEGLTKYYGASVVVSETTFAGLDAPDHYHYRLLDKVTVKGKTQPLAIYEFFDADPDDLRERKLQTLPLFETGQHHYFAGEFAEAVKCFTKVLRVLPEDVTTKYYLERSSTFLLDGVPDEWQGVRTMEQK